MYARFTDQSVKRITSINGKKVEVVMQGIFRNISEDGNSVKSKYDLAEQAFGLLYARHVELSPATFNIESVSVSGTKVNQAVAAVTWAQLQQLSFYEPEDLKPISFKMIGDTGYLNIGTFDSGSYGSAGIDYNDFLKTTFAELKRNNVQKLIVDIRRNGGGSDQYGANICSYFTTRPFSYFKTVKQKSGAGYTAVSHPCLNVQPAATNAFNGKICLLTDGLTFSTAADVASITSANHFARVIGRETGGGYDGNTSGRSESVQLTNSGISLTIPMWYYENAVPAAKESHRGVIPDVTITRTPESISQHRDLEMESALKWLGSKN
jgi:C-terminal processing protease CtpA/Prc